MALLVLISAFLIELFWQKLPQYRHHHWVKEYHDRWIAQIDAKHLENEWHHIAFVMLPPILLAGILLWSDQNMLGLLLQWGISVVVVLWSLGPVSIADKAFELGSVDELSDSQCRELLVYGHRGYFAVVFWFVMAGPVAALAYRLVCQFNDRCLIKLTESEIASEAEQRLASAWQRLFEIVDFIPARVTGVLFLLAGDFLQGFNRYQSNLKSMDSDRFVAGTAWHAIQDGDEPLKSLKKIKELMDRSLILLLVIVAIISVFIA